MRLAFHDWDFDRDTAYLRLSAIPIVVLDVDESCSEIPDIEIKMLRRNASRAAPLTGDVLLLCVDRWYARPVPHPSRFQIVSRFPVGR